MYKLLFMSLFMISSTFASGAGAQVLWLKGDVTYNNQKLSKGVSIALGATISTGKKSYVKLEVPSIGEVNGFTVTLGPNSSLALSDDPIKESESFHFIQGAARFVHKKIKDQSKSAPVTTAQVSIGVRGTEYLLKVNPALGESEIVLFEGKVHMGNLSDPLNSIDINPGQWGGLGGRFGNKIAPPITLPKEVYAGFKKLLKI